MRPMTTYFSTEAIDHLHTPTPPVTSVHSHSPPENVQPPVGRNRPLGRVAEGPQRIGRPPRLRRHAVRAETAERR